MFHKLGVWFRNFMMGRYGSDKLNLWLLGAGIVFMILGMVVRRSIPLLGLLFSLLCYAALFWSIFRTYSRNIEGRRRENQAFVNFLSHAKDRDHRYYRCPRCRQTVRVPSKRGKINIRCPKCGEQFIKKT